MCDWELAGAGSSQLERSFSGIGQSANASFNSGPQFTKRRVLNPE